jgi:hypothetical protein
MKRLALFIPLLIACACPLFMAAKPDQPTKIVLIAGGRSHGPGEHEFRAGCMKKYINLWNQHGVDGLDKPQTLMWGIERPDGGRGVGFTGGHYHRNWTIDGFRTLVLNALVWTAGMEVPAGGVKSAPLTEEQLNANLDKKGRKANLKLPAPGEWEKIPAATINTRREASWGGKN